jgi:hypothetical protein
VSQIIGTNQVRTDAVRMPSPISTARERRTPNATQPSQSGNSRKSSDWRIPPAMPRYHAARYASLRLPLSARKPK